MPFEDIEDLGKTNLDDVLKGKRQNLLRYLEPWMKDWLYKCWHMNPLERPRFEEIVNFLNEIIGSYSRESEFYTI